MFVSKYFWRLFVFRVCYFFLFLNSFISCFITESISSYSLRYWNRSLKLDNGILATAHRKMLPYLRDSLWLFYCLEKRLKFHCLSSQPFTKKLASYVECQGFVVCFDYDFQPIILERNIKKGHTTASSSFYVIWYTSLAPFKVRLA